MKITIVYILISVLGGAVGRVLLKKGVAGMEPLTLALNQLPGILWIFVANPYVVIGLGIYVLSTVFWLTALSHVDLSYAYAFVSLSFILMPVASWGLFDENTSPLPLLETIVVG
jgi:multidrug transporter EmrE-like cation transporter